MLTRFPANQALRTLHLLENHHKQLAEILRFQHENPASATTDTSAIASPPNQTTQSATDGGNTKTTAGGQDGQGQPPRLPGSARVPSRESSSIASNLASARGIPAHHPRRGSPVSPTLSSQQAAAKIDAPSRAKTGETRLREGPTKNRPSRASAPRQPWSPPLPSATEITSQEAVPPETAEVTHPTASASTADDSFQKFYSTFEGLISKISAPLAFAGLPLMSEDPSKAGPSNRKSSAETKIDRHHAMPDRTAPSAEPDVNRLFSRAALRSVRDTAGPGNPAESFYVVPTTGGTMSYTGVLPRPDKENRRGSVDDGDDDFVDARETPSSPELRQTASSRNKAARRGTADKVMNLQNPKTLEELQMENNALKQLSDTLSKRLHMWEVNAQSSSMALQQSLRAMHHHNAGSPEQLPQGQGSSLVTSPVAPLSTPHALSEPDPRIKELEELVRRGEQELQRATRENDKLKNVLGRYRERWEKLKEGAKTRRESRSNDAQGFPNPKSPEIPNSPNLDAEPSTKPAAPATGSKLGNDTDTPAA